MSDSKASVILSAENCTIERGGALLVNAISLSLATGKTTVIMGHNGAGKSLLLQMLHQLITPIRGEIKTSEDSQQKMVFQRPVLLRRSALAHFSFVTGIKDTDEIASWFSYANLTDKMSIFARQLSGGEQQKLAMISALATKPDILFLDEPTANLDRESTFDIEQLIVKARQNGTSIVLISHSPQQARRLADQVVFMHKGRIMDECTADAFFAGNRSAEADLFLSER
ncbi:MAG: ABC transporter ATP-binding protein [Candidatus Puniceispirillaceae bacterium]